MNFKFPIKPDVFSKVRTLGLQFNVVVILTVIGLQNNARAQALPNTTPSLTKPVVWQARDLIQPADLALMLTNKKSKKPLILNIGVVEDIQGAKRLGAASKKENLDKLHQTLKKLPRSAMIVIYCGCCPFDKCPNIRPAFSMMSKMGFRNGKLLNLPVNLKQNWISKGYPMLSEIKG